MTSSFHNIIVQKPIIWHMKQIYLFIRIFLNFITSNKKYSYHSEFFQI
uniref:Uncharacterized protein n=1 Tax=Heterorhabditis bacteriophora TaxID=37862 RepID=A0A1I7WFB1_HETBA